MGTSTWLFQVILVGFTLPPPPASPHRFVTKSTEVSDALCPLPLSLPCRYLLALCTLLTVSAEFSISFQFSITARKMLLITITRLKLTHCHQLRAGRARFHHSAAHYSDIAALGGIKRIICHSPLHVISQISGLRLILLSGSDHRNQHWPDTKGLLTGFTLWWQTHCSLCALPVSCSLAGRRAETERGQCLCLQVARPASITSRGSPLSSFFTLYKI